jgi:voltage-gated potassium channel
MRARLRTLYDGETPEAQRFRYALLFFDIATVAFIVATSFVPPHPLIVAVDIVLGLLIALDLGVRIAIAPSRWREALTFRSFVDLVVIVSFLWPQAAGGVAFLRILRTLRLMRNARVVAQLRDDIDLFRRYEEIFTAAVNLGVFLFVMTGLVFASQRWTNPEIANYADALYFTVTALTTTGFGDIVLEGTSGRLVTVVIMIFGVTLFLRLAQVLFRPYKIRFRCPACGLSRHEPDAVHCKACGIVLNIPNDEA